MQYVALVAHFHDLVLANLTGQHQAPMNIIQVGHTYKLCSRALVKGIEAQLLAIRFIFHAQDCCVGITLVEPSLKHQVGSQWGEGCQDEGDAIDSPKISGPPSGAIDQRHENGKHQIDEKAKSAFPCVR